MAQAHHALPASGRWQDERPLGVTPARHRHRPRCRRPCAVQALPAHLARSDGPARSAYRIVDADSSPAVGYPDGAMTDAELRVRIRDLMANGSLPGEPTPIERVVPPPPGGRRPHMFVSASLVKEPGTMCAEVGPQVSYVYSAGLVVRVHAACDAVWKQERGGFR